MPQWLLVLCCDGWRFHRHLGVCTYFVRDIYRNPIVCEAPHWVTGESPSAPLQLCRPCFHPLHANDRTEEKTEETWPAWKSRQTSQRTHKVIRDRKLWSDWNLELWTSQSPGQSGKMLESSLATAQGLGQWSRAPCLEEGAEARTLPPPDFHHCCYQTLKVASSANVLGP